jgi:hypothetical protein
MSEIIRIIGCLAPIFAGLFGTWVGFYGIIELVRRTC